MPSHLPHSDERFRNSIENTIHVFLYEEKRFSKLLLNRVHFAKNSTKAVILVSIAFKRYIARPIWALCWKFNLALRGSSGRKTQAVKLQQKQVHHIPESKSANE